MIPLRFTKMHGLGNDFMVVDGVSQHVDVSAERIRELADRHTGIGFDQFLLVEPPGNPAADFRYRIFNADGTEVEHCGNGARCTARFVLDQRLTPKTEARFQTSQGDIVTRAHADGTVDVEMGIPRFDPASVPFDPDHAVADGDHWIIDADGQRIRLQVVNIGNPHAVVEVADVRTAPVTTLGPLVEVHPAFPRRVNVGFCQRIDAGFIRLRVWERGVGETQACGTGACAAAAAGMRTGQLAEQCKVSLAGGKLRVSWPGPEAQITMTGPTCRVFEGQVEW